MVANDASCKRFLTYLSYLLPALVLAIVVYVRLRLLHTPLERDEGEFAYMGQLLLKGIPPYVNAYTMKLPGVGAIYALFMMMFGQTPAGIHLGLLIVNVTSMGLVYLLVRRLVVRDTAVASCAAYAVLSLSQSVLGIFAHATHFVVLFALAGSILLLRAMDRNRNVLLFFSGVCFGLAFTMKQHAALLIIFAFLYLAWRSRGNAVSGRKHRWAGVALFLLGTIIPYAFIVVCTGIAGVFDRFWFWTVQYAGEYSTGPTLTEGFEIFFNQFPAIVESQLPLWLLAGAGCVFLGMSRSFHGDRVFMFGLLFFSFLAICPGLYFREHYFVLILPAVAMLAGFAITSAGKLLSSLNSGRYLCLMPHLLFMAAVAYGLYHERAYLFTLTPQEVSRAIYDTSPFPEALQVASYIKDHTAGDDRIAVLGSEPELYFYADRLSATGHIYMYGLMEEQPYAERMQLQMIREIESARPKYIVMANVFGSWLVQSSSPRTIFAWKEHYLKQLYELVGVVDIFDNNTTRYLWDQEVAGYTPVSHSYLTVYKRKGGA